MDERELKEKIEKEKSNAQMRSFSERWEKIKDRLADRDCERQAQPAYVVAPAVAGAGSARGGSAHGRRRLAAIISAASVLAVAVCLLIGYFVASYVMSFNSNITEYGRDYADEDEFYEAVGGAGFRLPDLDAMQDDIYAYGLIRNLGTGEVVGGYVAADSEEESYSCTIYFYLDGVTGVDTVGEEYSIYAAGGTEVKYFTEVSYDGIYGTRADARFNGLNYHIDYISLYDGALRMFEALFA